MKRNTLAAAVVLLGCVVASTAGAPEPVNNNAWALGEKLEYAVKYGPFSAGRSTFAVEGEETVGGQKAVKFTSILTSSRAFFFKVYDSATSFSDFSSLYSLRYEKFQHEADEKSSNVTVFNHTAARAVRTEDGKAHPSMTMVPYARDILGVIYYVRTQPLKVGKSIRIPVHDGKRDYNMEVVVRNKERVTVPAGQFDCLVVEPKLWQLDGNLKKKGQMVLWMTDDSRHLPVRIRMSIPVGSLVASLDKMTGVKPAL
ncbi:MAG: DUF3108 domain-containing protein [Candidatus Hydrogenedentota bacterium]